MTQKWPTSQLRGVDGGRSKEKLSPVSDRAALYKKLFHLAKLIQTFGKILVKRA